jgi:hypothetical protein
VPMRFEEEQPAFAFLEVDLDVAVGHFSGVDAAVADVSHEARELAERICLPSAVAEVIP